MFDCLIIMKFQSGHRNMAPAWVSSDWKEIRHNKFREKIGFFQFMIAGFDYDWTIMDKE